MTAVQKAEAQFKGVTEDVHSVADGQVINIEDVKTQYSHKNDG